jgi:hypothetical protein
LCLKKRITTGYSQQRINKSGQSSVLMMPTSDRAIGTGTSKPSLASGQRETVEPGEKDSSGRPAETGPKQNKNRGLGHPRNMKRSGRGPVSFVGLHAGANLTNPLLSSD